LGQLGKKIAGVDQDLLRRLLCAYADEWFGHYNYSFVAHMVAGPSSASISELMRAKSALALSRAERLAERIIELGGTPVPKLTELNDYATDKPFKLPENLRDIEGLLRVVLDADRTSLRTFTDLYEATRDRDPLTARLLLDLQGEAVHGEQQLERLLADPAPEMTGT
jgi:bacterioferritin